jgi:hypothetical protein
VITNKHCPLACNFEPSQTTKENESIWILSKLEDEITEKLITG